MSATVLAQASGHQVAIDPQSPAWMEPFTVRAYTLTPAAASLR